MEKTKIISLSRIDWRLGLAFFGCLGVAIFLPLIVHQQFITGPIINATLFLSAALLGTEAAVMVGLIPSVAALGSGLLPAVLAPMVPFIMISNILLVIFFRLIKSRNAALAVLVAAVIKFAFLWSVSSLVVSLIAKPAVAQKVAAMMSWPQLVTALAGGVIALGILKMIKGK